MGNKQERHPNDIEEGDSAKPEQIVSTAPPPVMWACIAISALLFAEGYLLWKIFYLQHILVPDSSFPTKQVFDSLRIQRLFYIILFIVLPVAIFYFGKKIPLPAWVAKAALLIYSVISTLLLAEGAFMFIPKSAADGNQLSHIIWMSKYWDGYIPPFDTRPNPMNLRKTPQRQGKTDLTIFTTGDSFGAGDGIEDARNIFSSILCDSLWSRDGINCRMINVCERGDGPEREFENMVAYSSGSGIVPNIVLWQYYGNDIEEVAPLYGKTPNFPKPSALEDFGSDYLRKKSFLTDYIFWNFIHAVPQQEYLQYLEGLYNDQTCVEGHLNPIINAAQWCKAHNASMVVIIFPILNNPDWSEKVYAQQLSTFLLTKLNIPCLDLAEAIKALPPDERVVNSRNPHPSRHVHEITAQLILNKMRMH